jgi:hypothetical protein
MSDPEDPLTPALREEWLRRRRRMRSAGLGLAIWTILGLHLVVSGVFEVLLEEGRKSGS